MKDIPFFCPTSFDYRLPIVRAACVVRGGDEEEIDDEKLTLDLEEIMEGRSARGEGDEGKGRERLELLEEENSKEKIGTI
ncbi:5413_t:CDS:2 [Diversispora eburnea]|uniref:5413_t:CDS:1 n=1 Tax=Diversispora eburnea TaxID=1213867 RepID=A0A9N9FHB6_9GLOM|nr:5413_t:CDS:2 [Diversispora eburnea]